MSTPPIAGVLLTGGESRRLGRDKATLRFLGETLAVRAARVLSEVCAVAVEVGAGVSGLPAVREDPSGAGPLAALVAGADALHAAGPILLFACDLPGIDAAFLRELADRPGSATVVPDAAGRLQYVCARYAADAIPTARALLAEGEYSLRALVAAIDTSAWPVVDPARFDDVDTPEDVKRLGAEGGR